jgi:hypothetical protein
MPARRTLQRIEIATHCVPSLTACVPAYVDCLGYRVVHAGPVTAELAAVWGAPAMQGKPSALLQPASGAAVYLRFIETGRSGGYWPPVTQGWIATEILATDPDALLARLAGTAFRHVSGPADLYPAPKSARALQMAGPAGELMYFTRLLPGGSRFGLHGARCFVDRPFIMVVGGASMAALEHFYGATLGQRIFVQEPFRIKQMSRVLGVPESTAYPISLAGLPGRSFLLELEELPAGIARRTVPAGELPEGLAMVSFQAAPPAGLSLPFRAPPCRIDVPPYAGRTVAVVAGPAGEWLELIS